MFEDINKVMSKNINLIAQEAGSFSKWLLDDTTVGEDFIFKGPFVRIYE